MKFAFIADQKGWAFDRTGQAMLRYGQTGEHTWTVFYTDPKTFEKDALEQFDLVRVGGLPLFMTLHNHDLIPKDKRRYVPTIASFWDIDYHLEHCAKFRDVIAGVIVNDMRFRSSAMAFDRPIIYSPDKVDGHVFYRQKPLERTDEVKHLRVGWAGSEHYWPQVKNVDGIAEACRVTGYEFVRQDREKDGKKTADAMREWFNTLDVYVSFNIERSCTPVPVLEAISCGVPIITTRCGDLWPMIAASCAGKVLSEPSMQELVYALRWINLAAMGCNVDLIEHVRWETSLEAREVTAAMSRLARSIER